MRTPDLIESLATDLRPVESGGTLRLFAAATIAGAAVSLLVVLEMYGAQRGLAEPAALLPFAMKAVYALALGGLALTGAIRLARPGGAFGGWRALTWPVGVLGALAVWWLATTPTAAMPHAVLGHSWTRCPFRIAGLSLFPLAALIVALRGRAPTDLRRAGTAIGLMSGAAAALAYAVACNENSPAFVLIWYSLGIALATGIGALVGPRLLRW